MWISLDIIQTAGTIKTVGRCTIVCLYGPYDVMLVCIELLCVAPLLNAWLGIKMIARWTLSQHCINLRSYMQLRSIPSIILALRPHSVRMCPGENRSSPCKDFIWLVFEIVIWIRADCWRLIWRSAAVAIELTLCTPLTLRTHYVQAWHCLPFGHTSLTWNWHMVWVITVAYSIEALHVWNACVI